MRRLVALLILFVGVLSISPAAAQNQGKPLILPVALPPGPQTWLLGQPYGNTIGAFYNGDAWYRAGQRLHFGIDLAMPCGTPLVAVADGEVVGVSDLNFGSAPHNLILRHYDYNITTLYGHLLEQPNLVPGQFVRQGDIVGLSGDPDLTCDSRPHLHFEVRSLNYRTAYNPVDYINANWDMLATIGSFSSVNFQRDLDNARRWLTLQDQPEVAFGGAALNDYAAIWPPEGAPAANPPLPRETLPPPTPGVWTTQRLGYDGCCYQPWWHPLDPTRLYTIDGSPGQRAGVYEWLVGGEPAYSLIQEAPPALTSPDGSIEVRMGDDRLTQLRRVNDGAAWTVNTNGILPAVSPDNTRLLWQFRRGGDLPTTTPAPIEFWLSDIDGANVYQLALMEGGRGGAEWLDANRILISYRENQVTTLGIFDLSDNRLITLGAWERLRGLSIAPGGDRVMFYIAYPTDPEAAGVYVLNTVEGALAQKLPWFGGWRWRDADSVYYIPFEPTTNQMRLAYYHIPSGDTRLLTDPATTTLMISNGDWRVSPDGRTIVYNNAIDLTMWLLQGD